VAKESSKLLVLAMRQDSVHHMGRGSRVLKSRVLLMGRGPIYLASVFDLRVRVRVFRVCWNYDSPFNDESLFRFACRRPIPHPPDSDNVYARSSDPRSPWNSIPDKENPIMTLAPQAYVNIYYATQLSGLFAQSLKRTRYCRFSRWYASFC